MINKTEKLTETLAKAIELTCEKISKQSHQIAELGKETRTGIDIRISFDLSDFDTCVWLPTVSVENTYLEAEVDALVHDIERYVGINAELTTEIETLQAEVKKAAKRNTELHAELERWVSAAEMAGLVVRCKECIHFTQGGWCDREFDWFPVDENDFCSMAEKMEVQE